MAKRRSKASDTSSPRGSDEKGAARAPSFADAMANLEGMEPIDRENVAANPPPTSTPGTASIPHDSSSRADRSATQATRSPVRASRAEIKRMRAGKIRPQQTIDLHGFTRDNAYRRLCNEVARAGTAGLRCVLVIHGKGRHSSEGSTTIRESLAEWLETPPLVHQVTGCTLAQPRDGGSGASYLLLR